MTPCATTPCGSIIPIRYTPVAPGVRHPVKSRPVVGTVVEVFTVSGAGGAKTQPTGTMLEDVVVELDVWVLEVVEFVEDVVEDEVDDDVVELVEVVVEPL